MRENCHVRVFVDLLAKLMLFIESSKNYLKILHIFFLYGFWMIYGRKDKKQ